VSRRPPAPIARALVVAVLVAAAAGCTSGSGGGPSATTSPTGTTGVSAVPKTPPPTVAPDPLAVYQSLVGQWQASRTAFLGLVTSGRRLSLAAEHAAAGAFLAAERRFVAAMAPANWPIRAASAIAVLRRISVQMQSHLVAMTRAGSGSAFTERLADYSTDVARDEAAIRAVEAALGG
jgi:hypothetical protein